MGSSVPSRSSSSSFDSTYFPSTSLNLLAVIMSPIGLGSTFGIASEFTNEIYDISHEANQAASKEDGGDLLDNFIAGEPASFQKELLQGLGFLQERIQRSEHNPDSITVIANRIWDTATALSTIITNYFN